MGKKNRSTHQKGKGKEEREDSNLPVNTVPVELNETPIVTSAGEVASISMPEVDVPPAAAAAESNALLESKEDDLTTTINEQESKEEIDSKEVGEMPVRMTLFNTPATELEPSVEGKDDLPNSTNGVVYRYSFSSNISMTEITFDTAPRPLDEDDLTVDEEEQSVWKVVTDVESIGDVAPGIQIAVPHPSPEGKKTISMEVHSTPMMSTTSSVEEQKQEDLLSRATPYLLALSGLLNDHSPVTIHLDILANVLQKITASYVPRFFPRVLLSLAQLNVLLSALFLQLCFTLTWNGIYLYFYLVFYLPLSTCKRVIVSFVRQVLSIVSPRARA